MDRSRVAVYATVGVIVLVTVASGPLVGVLAVPEAGISGAAPGTGNATVTVVSAPDTARIDRGGYNTSVYYLEVPDATLDVSAVSGKPIVTYSLNVEALGYSRSTVYFLTEEGRTRISLSRDALDPADVTRERYTGRVQIVLRGSDTERILYNETVRIEVTG